MKVPVVKLQAPSIGNLNQPLQSLAVNNCDLANSNIRDCQAANSITDYSCVPCLLGRPHKHRR